MISLEPAPLATKDTIYLMELAFSRFLITLRQLIQAVVTGIGTARFAWLARRIGCSIEMECVYQLAINVLIATLMDCALHVIKDTI